MRAESHKQSVAQSAEKTSNQNIALNGSSVTASAISGGSPHRPSSGLNSGKHLSGLTRLASLSLATILLAACGGDGGGVTDPASNVTISPDDGAVSYTLNIIKQSTTPDISLNVTTTITGTCSITPNGITELDYNSDKQASIDYTITFTGTATASDTCDVNFVVTEDEQATTITRSIIFNLEQAPTLVAELVGNGVNIPASGQAIVELTATKQDTGKSRSRTFLNNIVYAASSSCATIFSDVFREQYITVISIFTAGAIFNRHLSGFSKLLIRVMHKFEKNLGFMYRFGKGVKRGYKKAFEWRCKLG